MENNIINQDLSNENMTLLFDPRSKEDTTYIKNQIQSYYDATDSGVEVQDMKLVGFTDEGYPEYMVDLGNDRYEKRTIKADLRDK